MAPPLNITSLSANTWRETRKTDEWITELGEAYRHANSSVISNSSANINEQRTMNVDLHQPAVLDESQGITKVIRVQPLGYFSLKQNDGPTDQHCAAINLRYNMRS